MSLTGNELVTVVGVASIGSQGASTFETTVQQIANLSPAGSVTSVGVSGGTTGLSFSNSPITGSGTMTASGTLIVANGGTGIASGTSGGIPYFSATSTIASSAALTATALVKGGGAGVAPSASTVLVDGSNNLTPTSNDGGALGTTSLQWADLRLASGGVIGWNNGDVTITHSSNTLDFAGASSGYTFDAQTRPSITDTTVDMDGYEDVGKPVYSVLNYQPSGNTAVGVRASVLGYTALSGTNDISGTGHIIGTLGVAEVTNASADCVLVIGTEGRAGVKAGTATICAGLVGTLNTNTEDVGTATFGIGCYIPSFPDQGQFAIVYPIYVQATQTSLFTGAINQKVLVEAVTAGTGAPNVLTDNESFGVYTNEGAGALTQNTLPSALASGGQTYTFIVQDSDGIRVVAQTGDTIRLASSVSATGGRIDSTTVGSAVTLVSINATEWIATSIVGVWAVT